MRCSKASFSEETKAESTNYGRDNLMRTRMAQATIHLLRPFCRHVDAWEMQIQQVISSPSGSPYHPVFALPSDQDSRTSFQRLYLHMLESSRPIPTSKANKDRNKSSSPSDASFSSRCAKLRATELVNLSD